MASGRISQHFIWSAYRTDSRSLYWDICTTD